MGGEDDARESKHRSRDRERDGHHRDRGDRDRKKDRDRERDKEGRRDRDDSGRDRHRDRRREKDRDRDRDRDKDRGRDDRDRRDREKAREKTRSASRGRRREERSPSAGATGERAVPADDQYRQEAKRARVEGGMSDDVEAARQKALDAEEVRKRAREAEQAELEEEMEKRRKRVEAWQAQRRKLAEEQQKEEEAQQAEQAAQQQPQAKAWTLEDESDEEEDEAAALQGASSTAAAAAGERGGGDAAMADAEAPSQPPPTKAAAAGADDQEGEEDPLDAFMKQNSAAATAQRDAAGAAAPASGEDDEVDPLDAFMQANVLPEVQQVKEEPEQEAADTAEGAAGGAEAGTAEGNGQPAAGVKVEVKQEEGEAGAGAQPAGPRPGSGAAVNGEVSSRPSSVAAAKRRRGGGRGGGRGRPFNRYGSDSSDDDYDSSEEEEAEKSEDDEEWMRKVQAGKLTKGDKLQAVDHESMNYPPFRRNFYIEVPELARMSGKEVEEYRAELDGVKVRGKNVPKPIRNWHQCGLSGRILEALRKGGFEAPLSIQAQALPVIMSGRDCIGIAKTGSGKTLGFVLPMLRHVKDQPPLQQGDGPVALIMAPTRELVTQIGKEVKRFAKAVNLQCVCVFGGSGVANQITELKRGTEIVVCTPGRMIDLLVTSGGKITNLRRVTYLVLDEADRMFDMGFEPQIMRIVQNIRPDRQTVMFSATFPRSVEVLARQVLVDPVEILVGGRSVVNKDITQFVEIRPEEERFLRLLEVLGEWYEKGKILIFVQSQERCDNLFRDLLKSGYPCLSLHGGKDQSDRQSTIADYKSGVGNILVATSVAARGLDVRDLVLVINYDVPNHHEDYVHRVGRTGRAGNKGTAITFIGPEEDQYSPDLVKALSESGQPIPQDLGEMCAAFEAKRKSGQAVARGSGYGGSGFKFDSSEEGAVKALKKAIAKEHGIMEESEGESDDDDIRLVETKRENKPQQAEQQQGDGEVETAIDLSSLPPEVQERVKAAQALANKLAGGGSYPPGSTPMMQPGVAHLANIAAAMSAAMPGGVAPAQGMPMSGTAGNPMLAAAQAAAQRLAAQAGMPHLAAMQQLQAVASQPVQLPPALLAAQQAAQAAQAAAALKADEPKKHFETELEINDFPQHARWKITHRDTINDIGDMGAAMVVKGRYFKPGDRIPEGERKLYLIIEGPTETIVRQAKQEVKRILEEYTEKAMRREGPSVGRYSIV